MNYWTIIFFFLMNPACFAQDIGLLSLAVEQLGLEKSTIKEELVVYKRIPGNTNETILVIPEIINEDKEGYWMEFNSYILVVDSQTGLIKNKYFESSETNHWISDAIELTDITIDTAPYQISASNRAFGIRVHYYGMSRANPYSKTTISLFIKSKKTLKKILTDYDVMRYGGEWDTNCAGEFIDEKKTLAMTSEKSNGFYDILIKNNITVMKNFEDEKEECVYNAKKHSKKTVLKFNGQEYKEHVL